MAYSVQDIATALGAQAFGAVDLLIDAASEPAAAGPRDLALAMDPKYGDGLAQGQARAAILWPHADWQALGLEAAIFVPRPRYAMSGLTALMDPGPEIEPGVHPSAIVHPEAQIGEGAAIGPFVAIGMGARIGANARIASHVSVAEGAQIGADALLCQGVRIGARVVIGDRFIAQPGAVVGSDGFSFVTPEKSGVESVRETLGDQGDAKAQSWTRIHSLGAVRIGDDVELGANVAIDRGTIRDTSIGNGTKLDNLVHIGHNVEIGQDCLICGQVGMAGSAQVGDRVVLAGQCGVNDNIFIGDDVIAGGATKIFTNAPKGRVLLGYPAMKMDSHVEAYKGLRRLPRLFRDVAELKKAVLNRDQSD
ncbi:MAG: UDP-3-O-(3-hydroxymyristoyl)glucosamine N-acyltransferase [Pseudomonadota bacterium]